MKQSAATLLERMSPIQNGDGAFAAGLGPDFALNEFGKRKDMIPSVIRALADALDEV